METTKRLGKKPKNTVALSIGGLIERYQSYNESVGKAPATLARYRYSLTHFETFTGSDFLAELLDEAVLDDYRLYLVRRDISLHTVNSYLRDLRACLNWAARRRLIAHPPVIEFVRHDPLAAKTTFLPDEFSSLVKASEGESTLLLRLRARAILYTLFDTGLRASELCRARFTDVRSEEVDGLVGRVLLVQGAKRGGPRNLPLHDTTWAAIEEYRAELLKPHGRGFKKRGNDPTWLFVSSRSLSEPLSVSGLRRMCERLVGYAATIQTTSGEDGNSMRGDKPPLHANPHKFRHSFVSGWVNHTGGEEIEPLLKIAGWRDRRMLEVYAHYETTTIMRSARRNSPLNRK